MSKRKSCASSPLLGRVNITTNVSARFLKWPNAEKKKLEVNMFEEIPLSTVAVREKILNKTDPED